MRAAQAQQHLRHADIVVEVALGSEHRIGRASFHLQDRGEHFLHRGLAVAAGDGDDRNRETAAPRRRQTPECQPRVIDADRMDDFGRLGSVEHHAGRALLQGLRGEGAAVEFFAA
jgi:hypothetical protein